MKAVRLFSRMLRGEDGKSAVEVAVLLALVTAALAFGVAAFSGSAKQSWDSNADNLGQAMSGNGMRAEEEHRSRGNRRSTNTDDGGHRITSSRK